MLRLLWFYALSTQHQVVIRLDVPFQKSSQAKKKRRFEESSCTHISHAQMAYILQACAQLLKTIKDVWISWTRRRLKEFKGILYGAHTLHEHSRLHVL